MRKRPPSKFGAALIQEYKKHGLTQYSLAKKLGRSTRYLNNLEHDRSEPRFTTILLLADAIGMEPGELVNTAAALSWEAWAEEEAALGEAEEMRNRGEKAEGKKVKNSAGKLSG